MEGYRFFSLTQLNSTMIKKQNILCGLCKEWHWTSEPCKQPSNPKFRITVHRKPWNKTAEAALDIAKYIAAEPDQYSVSNIADFSLELVMRLQSWCLENKKDPKVIDISTKNNWLIWINKAGSADGSAINIVLNHIADVFYGPRGSGKTTEVVNRIRMMPCGNARMLTADENYVLPGIFEKVKEGADLLIFDECTPEFPLLWIDRINEGKCRFIFICQKRPDIPCDAPFRIISVNHDLPF